MAATEPKLRGVVLMHFSVHSQRAMVRAHRTVGEIDVHSTFQAAHVPRPDLTPVPVDTDALLRRFAANPWGPHDVELQTLLNAMRAAPVAGKLVVMVMEPHRSWRLARLPARRGGPLEPLPGPAFTALADAEIAAFRLRLAELPG